MRRKNTRRIIFHHSLANTSSAADIDAWHRARGFDCIGYHYAIRRDGTIEHGRDVRDIGAHANGSNFDSVGVCLEGDFRHYPPTPEQIESAGKIVHDVCRAYQSSLRVEFHHELCPGPMLDRNAFSRIVNSHNPYR